MLKSRMLVGTHVTAGRTQAGITCRAAEFLVALGYADGAGRSQIVESMSQVRQQIAEMNKDLRAAYGAGHVFLSCRKYDFVAFFQEVPRQEVKRSLQFWSYVNKRRYKGRNTVRIDSQARTLYGRAHPREDRWKQGSGYVPRCPDCTLVRGGGNPGTGIYYIPTRAIPDYLDADARILIATGTDLSQQQTGLTIGSSWGGTGAKLWASHRELLQEWQRTRQRRHMTCPHCGAQCDHTYEATAHGGGNSRTRAMRWVDDRWVTIMACCEESVGEASRMEYLKYTAWPATKKIVLAKMWPPGTQEDRSEEYWQRTVDNILSYLGKYIGQTRENVQEVVGADIGVQHEAGHSIQRIPEWGEVARITAQTRFVTRPHTKDTELMLPRKRSGMEHTHPRIHPRRLCQGSEETRRVMAATMIRFADTMNPVWSEGFWPDETLLKWWAEPWTALRRELLSMGWGARMWLEAAKLTGLEPHEDREPCQQHRARVVWTMALRAAQVCAEGGEGCGSQAGDDGEDHAPHGGGGDGGVDGMRRPDQRHARGGEWGETRRGGLEELEQRGDSRGVQRERGESEPEEPDSGGSYWGRQGSGARGMEGKGRTEKGYGGKWKKGKGWETGEEEKRPREWERKGRGSQEQKGTEAERRTWAERATTMTTTTTTTTVTNRPETMTRRTTITTTPTRRRRTTGETQSQDPPDATSVPPACEPAPMQSPRTGGTTTQYTTRVSMEDNTPQHRTTQHNTTQHRPEQQDTTQYNTIQHNTTQRSSTRHDITQHNMTPHGRTAHVTTEELATEHNKTRHHGNTHHTPHRNRTKYTMKKQAHTVRKTPINTNHTKTSSHHNWQANPTQTCEPGPPPQEAEDNGNHCRGGTINGLCQAMSIKCGGDYDNAAGKMYDNSKKKRVHSIVSQIPSSMYSAGGFVQGVQSQHANRRRKGHDRCHEAIGDENKAFVTEPPDTLRGGQGQGAKKKERTGRPAGGRLK